MKWKYKTICVALSLSSIFSGCGKEETLRDTQPQKVTATSYHDRVSQLAEIVAKLSEELFSQGGVINLGKTQEGSSKYAVINVLKENRTKTLDISLYIGSDPNIETKLEEYLLSYNYKSAAEILSKSNLMSMTKFYDSRTNGLRSIDINDFLRIKDKEGKIITLTSEKLYNLLKETNETYNILLEKIEPVLKKLKSKKTS